MQSGFDRLGSNKLGAELLGQADVLATFTEDAPRLTRTYLTEQHRAAGDDGNRR